VTTPKKNASAVEIEEIFAQIEKRNIGEQKGQKIA
jgi:hypothetical protein